MGEFGGGGGGEFGGGVETGNSGDSGFFFLNSGSGSSNSSGYRNGGGNSGCSGKSIVLFLVFAAIVGGITYAVMNSEDEEAELENKAPKTGKVEEESKLRPFSGNVSGEKYSNLPATQLSEAAIDPSKVVEGVIAEVANDKFLTRKYLHEVLNNNKITFPLTIHKDGKELKFTNFELLGEYIQQEGVSRRAELKAIRAAAGR